MGAAQKAGNHTKLKVRSRVEHVFGCSGKDWWTLGAHHRPALCQGQNRDDESGVQHGATAHQAHGIGTPARVKAA